VTIHRFHGVNSVSFVIAWEMGSLANSLYLFLFRFIIAYFLWIFE